MAVDALLKRSDQAIMSQRFEKPRSARSEPNKVTAAVHTLLLGAQQLHEDSSLAPREFIQRIAPSRQVYESDAVCDIVRHESCRTYCTEVAA
jgi:hypothetical protein